MSEIFDYIIIGAGSAGCVLANRLSADPTKTVLLLEAGPKDKSIWLKVPAGITKVFSPGKYNWAYFTQPEPNLDGRQVYWPRGRTLGGSSSINGMVYLRGHPDDYNNWAQLGAKGWTYDEVLPYFKKHENNTRGANESHGVGGELTISDPVLDDKAGRLFMEAAANTGTPYREDLNDGVQHGVSRAQVTIKNRKRDSTSTAFLNPIKSRGNLHIECEALARKIVIEDGKAVGVRFEQGGTITEARADKEVILSGGVVNSPQLMMLSGIGPADHLRDHGIEVVKDLPGVGQNLQDHFYAYYNPVVKKDISWNKNLVSTGGQIVEALKYFSAKRGKLNMGAVQATAFPIVGPGATRPDVEISFRPVSLGVTEDGETTIHDFPGVNASCSLLRPLSSGHIELASSDPKDYPKIYANYIDHEMDLIVMREGLKWIRKVFATQPLADYVVEEYSPNAEVQTDDEWEDYIRATANSVYHPVGTCKMGVDKMAVVDPDLRVHGIDGLRVIDASVMPTITSSNTNGPTIMIAEKGSEIILKQNA